VEYISPLSCISVIKKVACDSKIVPKAACVVYNGESQPIAEKQSRKMTNGREEKLGQKF